MARIKKRRSAKYTVLVVCEGITDENFIKYLKSLYIIRCCGTSVKVKNAFGKNPEHIVSVAVKENYNADFDRTIVFLDTDIQWNEKVKKRAKSKKLIMLGSEPCLEGLLLTILGEQVPVSCRECKGKLKKLGISGLTSSHYDYQKNFPLSLLEQRRKDITLLDELITNLTQ